MHRITTTIVLLLSALLSLAYADNSIEDTMLMFVGEEKSVVTAASRFPESPLTAPAMVTLIEHDEIQRKGYRTLGELIADQPGFFVVNAGRGSVVFLRGLRDAVLFLYDGVPLTTDITKSFAPLDREFSINAVQRVEIITGPGSVLWGTDAFAAVVNIVPSRGSQRPGWQLGSELGNQSLAAGSLSWGHAGTAGDAFLQAATSAERFHADRYQAESDSTARLDPSRLHEIVANLNLRDRLQISGRWSDFTRRYTMVQAEPELIWEGEKQAPFNYIKATTTANIGPSHYSLTGFYHQTDFKLRDADIERSQRNRTSHVELLWDRRLFGRGLITAGASWRRNDVDGAVIRDGFQPGFLQPDQPLFVPSIDQRDYSSDIFALFGQMRYRWGNAEGWIGARYENHSDYNDSLTSTLGLQFATSTTTRLKIIYGNAVRTPYSRQLFDDQPLNQERISTISAQWGWFPMPEHHYQLSLFHNSVKYHRSEDPFGGLSLENQRESWGAELSLQAPVSPVLKAHAGLSWVDAGHQQDEFEILAFSIIRPDGSREDFFENWSQPAHIGPEWILRFSLDWSLARHQNLVATLSAAGNFETAYNKGTSIKQHRTPTMVDVTYNRPGFFPTRDRLTLRVTNLFDARSTHPDVYGPVTTEPRRITLSWQLRF